MGFNRRFAPDWAAARALLDDGTLGTPRLIRSVTRDPGGFDPSRVAPDTIFNETLIHDFDALRFLNPGAEAVEVYAIADALVEPDWRDRGLLDTAVVTVRFDNGAVGVAEACFEAKYGYDVRGEVFGSGGMATMGDGRRTGMVFSGPAGRAVDTVRGDQELLAGAYVAELAAFVDAVRGGTPAAVGGEDARAALAIALAAAQSVRDGPPGADRGGGQVTGPVGTGSSYRLAVSAEMVFVDLPFEDRVRRIADRGFEVEIWDWTQQGRRRAGQDRGDLLVDDRLHHRDAGRPGRRRGAAADRRAVVAGRRGAGLPAAERARHRSGRQGPAGRRRRT